MHEQVTTVTRKGQITIPVDIRKAMGIQIGDMVSVSLTSGDTPVAELRRAASVAEQTFGAVATRQRPEDFKELRQLFMEGQGQEEVGARRPMKKRNSRR